VKVLGFVGLTRSQHGAFTHVRGSTITCRWPGCAEDWLNALVENGAYAGWEPLACTRDDERPLAPLNPAHAGQAEYRGARVFRLYPAPDATTAKPKATTEPDGCRLMAVWEGRI